LVGIDYVRRTLIAHVIQQRVNALMIALNGRARPVQLYKARQDFQRQHHCTPSLAKGTLHTYYAFLATEAMWLLAIQRAAGGAAPNSN
jgi:hypothetical protein